MLRVIQINLQHSRAASDALCRILASGRIDVALIQEPWLVKGRVAGLEEAEDKLIYDLQSRNARSCIFVINGQNALTLPDFCCRDMAVIKLKYHVAGADKNLVLVSAYLPYDSPNLPPSEELKRLERFCGHLNANAHHIVWGAPIQITEVSLYWSSSFPGNWKC
jgi:hypothetical protein